MDTSGICFSSVKPVLTSTYSRIRIMTNRRELGVYNLKFMISEFQISEFIISEFTSRNSWFRFFCKRLRSDREKPFRKTIRMQLYTTRIITEWYDYLSCTISKWPLSFLIQSLNDCIVLFWVLLNNSKTHSQTINERYIDLFSAWQYLHYRVKSV